MMKLDGLEPLYRSMQRQRIERYKFQFSRNSATFDVFFFIDVIPYELLFGCIGTQFAFTLEVNPGFIIHPLLDKYTYKKLCEELGLQPNPNNRFSPIAFFQDFNAIIPCNAIARHLPKPHEIGKYRRDIEEFEKIYFMGWRNNSLRNESVTNSNLEKTLRLLGRRTYDHCKRHNVSSCWTDNPSRTVIAIIPS